ncbi:phosphatidate cytidylyltransferase [Actinomadura alba]|uniref:phosphatidate cytidylyltransferase n=1 Tax=Actinomadura alba TaxID=406431 RepID=UPI001FE43A3B|nr:phosphatidate cytidylyltransferase [Actinomadura alba]
MALEQAREPDPSGEDSQESAKADGDRPPGKKRGPGRNLPIAIGVGLGLGTLVVVSLYTRKEIFLLVLVVFLTLALRELTDALATRGIRVPLIPVAVGNLAMLVCAYVYGAEGLIGAFALTGLVLLIWRMAAGAEDYVRDVTAGVFTVAYIPFLGGFAALLLEPGDGAERIVAFIAITAASDIGGFFAGTFLGRHKLAPAISPKKTWEGLAGSALACMLVGAWLLPWLLDARIWQGAVLGAAVVCSATLGDLIESMIKRDLGVKDLGTLLPEHGGVMDRLDSLLVSAPVVWIALQIYGL